MRLEPTSSAGLGGTGPLVRTDRPGIEVVCATSANGSASSSALVRPRLLPSPKTRCSVGRRRSESMRQTREPVCASTTPKLATVVDLPSPGVDEVTRIVRHLWSSPANWMLVRSER